MAWLATRCCGEKRVFEGMEEEEEGVGSDHDNGTVEGGCI